MNNHKFFAQKKIKLSSRLSQPKFQSTNSVSRVALPVIAQTSSGTAIIETPTPNAIHSRHFSALKKNKNALMTNKTARL